MSFSDAENAVKEEDTEGLKTIKVDSNLIEFTSSPLFFWYSYLVVFWLTVEFFWVVVKSAWVPEKWMADHHPEIIGIKLMNFDEEVNEPQRKESTG